MNRVSNSGHKPLFCFLLPTSHVCAPRLHAHMCVFTHIHNLAFSLIEEKIALSDGLIFQHSVQEHFKNLTLSTDLNKTEESNK